LVTGGVFGGFNYCPAGFTPVAPPNTLPPNVTGVGYCQAVASVAYSIPVVTTPVVVSQPVVTTPVAYTWPVATTSVAYSVPVTTAPVVVSQPVVTRVASVSPRRTLVRRVASRTTPAYRRVAFRTRRTVGTQQAVVTGQTVRAQRVGFRTGQVQGGMGAMNRVRTY